MATKLKSRLTPAQEVHMVRDIYDNFPEASMCLVCEGYNYEEFRFQFIDSDTGKRHVVRQPDAIRGLRLFIRAVDSGKLPGLGLSSGYLDPEDGLCDWDAWAFDAVNQMAIFGEVIYG